MLWEKIPYGDLRPNVKFGPTVWFCRAGFYTPPRGFGYVVEKIPVGDLRPNVKFGPTVWFCRAGFLHPAVGIGCCGKNPRRGFTATYKMWPYGFTVACKMPPYGCGEMKFGPPLRFL